MAVDLKAVPSQTVPAGVSLRSYALAGLAQLVQTSAQTSSPSPEQRYLFEQLAAVAPVASGANGFLATLSAYLFAPGEDDARLVRLGSTLGLTVFEQLAVALAAAVEDDAMAGRALAWLQAPVGGSRPTFGLVANALAAAPGAGTQALHTLVSGAAIHSGLLSALSESGPLPERPFGVPIPICLALAGRDAALPGMTIGLGDMQPIRLPPSVHAQAVLHARSLITEQQRTLIVRAGNTMEGRSVSVAIAAALGLRPLFIETDKVAGLGPLLVLLGLLPVFCFDQLGPGDRRKLPRVPLYTGPCLALCGLEGIIEHASGAALSWSLPIPSREERRELWHVALGDSALAERLAREHRHGSGRIAQLARLARHRATLDGSARPELAHVADAAWAGEGLGLEALAQPLRDAISDEAMVMTPVLRRDLETLLLRCRSRDGLERGLGASATARYRPGVRALFVGPSGTGKTLAAGWLASRLQMPLYRVDLASVSSKYIGETEKNLAQLLAQAEQAEVVLLFDEADSMFGKRTEVKEANDRFANAQTNYLLQRIESFDGVTLLTSNSKSRFDAAFMRRLDLIIEFPLPGPAERRALWLSHLGAGHGLAMPQVNQLAAAVDLGGGHIRNAVLTAAVLAQARGTPIAFDDVASAVGDEYRKLGRQAPLEFGAKR
jgi:hypothetical protein